MIFSEFLHTLYGIIPGFRDLLRTFSGFFVEQGDTKNPEETSGGRLLIQIFFGRTAMYVSCPIVMQQMIILRVGFERKP